MQPRGVAVLLSSECKLKSTLTVVSVLRACCSRFSFLCIFPICLFFFFSCYSNLFAEASDVARFTGETVAEHSEDEPGKRKKKKKKRFKGYGKYNRKFRTLCSHIDKDGREGFFNRMMVPNVEKDPDCDACQPLFKVWSKACKPEVASKIVKKDRKKKKASKKRVVHRKQLEPSTAVINAAVNLFSEIEADKKDLASHFKAVKKVIIVLSDESGRTEGERNYALSVAEYIRAVFGEEFRKERKALQKKREAEEWRGGEEKEKTEGSVNSLFE